MNSGAHTIQECTCKTCGSYLGWRIVKAHEWPEKWKEGNCILELEFLTEEHADDSPLPSPLTTPTKKEYSQEETSLSPTRTRSHIPPLPYSPQLPPIPSSPTATTSTSRSKVRNLHMSKMLGIGHRRSNTDLSKQAQRSQGQRTPVPVPVPAPMPIAVQGSPPRRT